ncbi:MAG: chain-length determining protein [Bacteroidales bacterium]|nr:chain-length determining protein [Bacteroidales bacterium]MBQ8811338.1 chain-length determining protein [Bacteroidales bacterium]
MTEQYNNIPEEQEIDIMELISKLWKKRWMIIKWCVAGAIIGLVIGFSIPKTYKASTTLAPETEQRMGSGVSSIASMMGVSLDNSVDAISVEMFPDVVASTPFIYGLFDLPVTFERKDSVITTDLLDYMLEYQKSPWWSYVVSAPFKALGWVMSIGKEKESDELPAVLDPQNLPKKVRGVVKYFSENIIVTVDKKSGKTQISAEMQDPLVVATVVEAVMENLKAYMSDYRTSKVRQDVENLTVIYEQRKQDYYAAQQEYAQYADANKNVVLQSAQAERERLQQEMNLAYQVYSQIATQLEAARIKEQEAKPVFAVLEPVTIPNRKAAPSKAKMLVIFTFLAGCCAAAWVLFGEDYWKKLKENL